MVVVSVVVVVALVEDGGDHGGGPAVAVFRVGQAVDVHGAEPGAVVVVVVSVSGSVVVDGVSALGLLAGLDADGGVGGGGGVQGVVGVGGVGGGRGAVLRGQRF